MSDDEARPIDPPAAPTPPPAAPSGPPPAYAMPVPAYAAYAGPPPPERPRFVDQVLGMRAVVAVALACLIIGGLSGFILGHAAGHDGRFGGPRGFSVPQGGTFPNGQDAFPDGPNGPNQQFGQGQSNP